MTDDQDAARQRVEAYLRNQINGKHGESERRAVAQFVLDAMSGNVFDDPLGAAAGMAAYLAVVATTISREISGVYR